MASNRIVLHTRVVSGAGGGPDKTILNSPRFLEGSGYELLCAFMRHPRDPGFRELERRAVEWRAPLLAVDDFGPFDWRVVGRLRTICRQYRADIWHGHDYKSNLLGLLVRHSHPMPLVTTVHGWVKHTWKTPVYYAIDRFCLRHHDAVICVSQDLHRRCLDLGIPPDRCHLVDNAIDVSQFRRRMPSSAVKADRGMTTKRLVVGAVGRLSREKRFDLLIRALKLLVDEGLDLELWIAGEGDEMNALSRLVEDLALGDRVRLLGFYPEIGELYQAMDVFALSSIREGLPNALLEAMASEVAVVSTRTGGIARLLRDNENGLLVEPGSSETLARGLRRLAEDGELRSRLALAARTTVETDFSFGRRMLEIRAIYDRVLVGGAPA